MIDHLILTPSYNRRELLESLIRRICSEVERIGCSCVHVILDDGSDPDQGYADLVGRWERNSYRIAYLRSAQNCGRDRFWSVWDRLFQEARVYDFRYCLCLSDDLTPCRDFLRRITRAFEFVRRRDDRCSAMNLMPLFPMNWGLTGYVDGQFICTREFLEALDFHVMEIPKDRFEGEHYNRSSGVWQQVSKRIARTGRTRIAPVQPVQYFAAQDGESALFPREKFPDRAPNNYEWTDLFIDFAWRNDEPQGGKPPMETGPSPFQGNGDLHIRGVSLTEILARIPDQRKRRSVRKRIKSLAVEGERLKASEPSGRSWALKTAADPAWCSAYRKHRKRTGKLIADIQSLTGGVLPEHP